MNCRVCDTPTTCVVNINLTAVHVCDKCCWTITKQTVSAYGNEHIGQLYASLQLAESERMRNRAGLEMLAQVRHVTGNVQPHFRMQLRFVDAILAGADVQDVDTCEAIAAGTWKPKETT